MKDTIDRQEAIDAVAFGITYAKAFDLKTGEAKNLFEKENEALAKAVERIKELSPVQPDEEKISDALYRIYLNTSPHTSAEGVAAIKYYIREIYREIYGEEGPRWMKK